MGINSYVQICIMFKLSTKKIKKQDQLHSHPRKQTIPPKPIKRYTINSQNDQTYEECQITGVGDDKGNDSTASDGANGVKLLALYARAEHEHRLHPSKSLLGYYIYGHIKGDVERCWDNIIAPNWEKPEDPWKNDAILI